MTHQEQNNSETAPSMAILKERMNDLLSGQTVQSIGLLRENEPVIQFESGTRLFVDSHSNIEISIT